MAQPGRVGRRAVLIPLGVLALGGAFAAWLVTPRAFEGGATLSFDEVQPARSYVVGLVDRPSTEVTLSSVRLAGESVPADVRFLVCETGTGGGVGLATGTAEDVCDEVMEVSGAGLGPDATAHLVAEVTPTSTDPFTLDGVRVTYTTGLRFGRQTLDVRVAFGE